MPRYSHFWNLSVVLTFLKGQGHNISLSLKWLSIKTAMLMALTWPSRAADLAKLNLNTHSYTGKGVSFQPSHLSKQCHPSKPITQLFLSWIEKYEPVSSSTIARWLRTCLEEAGIDVNTFKAHSVRGAACSSAAWSSVTVADILNVADWSTETTFQQFYHQAIQDKSSFGTTVLSSAGTSNIHVDMETKPSEM